MAYQFRLVVHDSTIFSVGLVSLNLFVLVPLYGAAFERHLPQEILNSKVSALLLHFQPSNFENS